MPIREEDIKSPLPQAVDKLNEVLKNLSSQNISVLLLLSGGSSLSLLDDLDVSCLNSSTTIGVLDERYSSDLSENNFAQIAVTRFYKKAVESECKFVDTRVKDAETQDELAERFNTEIKKWLDGNPNGKIVATIGMGDDGHVAGMMPYSENPSLFETKFDNKKEGDYVTSYDATGKNPYPKRVTANMNLMRKIDVGIAYIVGDKKKTAIERLRNDGGTLAETPARILREIKGDVFLFTDQ